MELNQIKTYLDSSDAQNRMKAIVELRNYEPTVVVPLLKRRMYDREFIIRSFVAIGFGNKQTEEAFQALLDLIQYDKDPNVRAEAANSLGKYGDVALPHLVQLFKEDNHWLVRQSIFAAMEEINQTEIILELCQMGLVGDDIVVKQTAIINLGLLSETPQSEEALEILLAEATNKAPEIRAMVARVLRKFTDPRAVAALIELRYDPHHRVVGATLEGLIN